jgi:S-adenosylmethionine-diacylglycerol 3-amino-3-carboxypropyl transferase
MTRQQSKSQVQLFKLIFTLSWEDPESDYTALKIAQGDRIMTITSGGCNTLSFLLHDPLEVFAVDINPSQSYLLELKIVSMKNLNHEEYLEFLGLKESNNKIPYYNSFKKYLSIEAKEFWDRNIHIIDEGLLFKGRYEKFVKLVAKFILLIQGRKRINDLFISRNIEEQKVFYHQQWDTKRTKFIFDLFFNKYILAKRGLKADYFHFDDGSDSFASSFFKRFSKVITDIPINGNYFLHLYLNGCYRSLNEMPDYLLKQNYNIIKTRLDRIKIVTGDAKNWLSELPDNFLNCFSLSNICELMNLEDTLKLFKEVSRTSFPSARICFRNLMIPREVPEILKDIIVKDEKLSKIIFDNDRSFVYGRVDAYNVKK